jgi:hypothetical protein
MKMEQTECSETLAYKIQTPGNYPEEIIQHSELGECLKTRILDLISVPFWHIMQPMVVIPYQGFGTMYWSHFRGSRNQRRKLVTL